MSSDPLDFLGEKSVILPGEDIYFHLNHLKYYLSEAEEFLEREASREAAEVEEAFQKLPHEADDIVFFNAAIRDRLERLQEYFPNILRKSLFVAIYSTVEPELDFRCDLVQKNKNQLFAARDLAKRGNGLQRYMDYLRKVTGIVAPKAQWDKLRDYEKLRDCIVHTQGNLATSRDKEYLREYISSHQLLELSNDEVIVKRGFCEEAIKNIETFFEKLAKA